MRSLFKCYENVPASLAVASLIRLAEINDSPLLLTTDSDSLIYRRHGRQTIPLVRPWVRWMLPSIRRCADIVCRGSTLRTHTRVDMPPSTLCFAAPGGGARISLGHVPSGRGGPRTREAGLPPPLASTVALSGGQLSPVVVGAEAPGNLNHLAGRGQD